ncbi:MULTISPECIES: virulence-associated E family protein [unclassified Yoonia]|uniref:virulence-associated E family protein n=1 Tax=unclassified Yoonia TaxID=2629118 RepID=UPI002AFF4C24|nr:MULTISPECIES: virulence-associated E family protein [unclassified Yoonia]
MSDTINRTDLLTVLTSTDGASATKTFTFNQDTQDVEKQSYGRGYTFAVDQTVISSIHDLNTCLIEMQDLKESFLIRGEPKPGIDMRKSRRLLHPCSKNGDPATFDSAARRWFCVDFDGIEQPDFVDVVDDPDGAVEYLMTFLPDEFQDVTCVWQFSSSQGMKPGQISCHLFFYSENPLSDDDLDRWSSNLNAGHGCKVVDPAVYRAVQPLYVAAPIFNGMSDPLPHRVGLRQGLEDTVSVVIPDVETPLPLEMVSAGSYGRDPGAGYAARLDQIGGVGGFHKTILAAIGSYFSDTEKPDANSLKADIRLAVTNSDAGGRSFADIERYMTDKFLDDMIDWIRPREAKKRAERKKSAPRAADTGIVVRNMPANIDVEDAVITSDVPAPSKKAIQAPENFNGTMVWDAEEGRFVAPGAADPAAPAEIVNENPIASEITGDADWEDHLIRNKNGNPTFNTFNASVIAQNHPALKECFTFDEFKQVNFITAPLPYSGEHKKTFKGREMKDSDAVRVTAFFNRLGYPAATKGVIEDAITLACEASTFHPVRAYLESLPAWDGVKRCDSWLRDYCGVKYEDEDHRVFVENIGSKWLIAAVARIIQPGCKVDTILVFEGKQGLKKSSAFKALFGEEFFGDSLPPMNNKDSSDYLRGKWGIELPEIEEYLKESKRDVFKSFISRSTEDFRPAYGRREIRYQRQCVFSGTVNSSVTDPYLGDQSGNRRIWPVAAGQCDAGAIARDRDMLWAEALHRFNAGEEWWLTKEVEALAERQQELRLYVDPWAAEIEQYLDGINATEASCTTIAKDALKLEMSALGRAVTGRISSILANLGWKRSGSFTAGPEKGRARFVRVNTDA